MVHRSVAIIVHAVAGGIIGCGRRWNARHGGAFVASRHGKATGWDHNRYAWMLLTCECENLRDPQAALPVAKKAVEMLGEHVAAPLDTLALAYFDTGDVAAAVHTEERALAALPQESEVARKVFQGSLDKYRAALAGKD